MTSDESLAEWIKQTAYTATLNCNQFHQDVSLLHGTPPSPSPCGTPEEQTLRQTAALFPPQAEVVVSSDLISFSIIHPNVQPPQRASTKGVYFKVNSLIRPPSGTRGGVCDSDCGFGLVVLEIDRASLPSQRNLWAALIALGLPVVSLVYSGGKSLHAVLRLNAGTRGAYCTHAVALLGVLAPFAPDSTSINPSRYTRLAGCVRIGGKTSQTQEMTYLNPEAPVWSPDLPCNEAIRRFQEGLLPLPGRPAPDGTISAAANGGKRTKEETAAIRKWAKEHPLNGDLDMEGLIQSMGWRSDPKQDVPATEENPAAWKHFIRCPWSDTHGNAGMTDGAKDAYIYEWRSSAAFRYSFYCAHGTCKHSGHHIGHFLERAEEDHPGAIQEAVTPWPDLSEGFEFLPEEGTPSPVVSEELADLWRKPVTERTTCAIFLALNRHAVRFLHDEETWLLWRGNVWDNDRCEGIREQMKKVLETRLKRARSPEEEDNINRFDNTRAIDSLIKYSRSDPSVATRSDQFNTTPWTTGCMNGTMDLKQMELLTAKPEHAIRNQVTVAYNPHAKCPRWVQHLLETHPHRPEVAKFLQRWFGYCLTGEVSEQKMVIFYGSGKNGKSTIVDTILRIMGSYAGVAAKSLLLSSPKGDDPTAANPAFTALRGKRMVALSETDTDVKISEASLKEITKGEPITARELYGNPITFRSQAKVVFSSNHRPRIKGTDEGVWRRIILVKFMENFDGREDPALEELIESEMEGIFAWIVEGCRQWQETGLAVPECILKDTLDYRREEDVIGMFIADNTEENEGGRADRKETYTRYRVWVHDSGMAPLSRPNFNRKLIDKGFRSVKSSGFEHWVGFSLKEEVLS